MTDDGDNDGRRAARPIVSLLVVISGGLGITLQQLSTGTPASTGRWAMLIIGSCIGGAASILATGLFERLLTWAGVGWAFLRRHTRLRTVVAGVAACALAVAAGLVIRVAYEALLDTAGGRRGRAEARVQRGGGQHPGGGHRGVGPHDVPAEPAGLRPQLPPAQLAGQRCRRGKDDGGGADAALLRDRHGNPEPGGRGDGGGDVEARVGQPHVGARPDALQRVVEPAAGHRGP